MTDSADIISSEEPARSRWRLSREAPPTGAGVRTTAMSAALTLVVTAGVATAAYRGTSSGTDPAALIPSSAFAVATADLSLPGGQSDALETMLGRFPGLHLMGDGSFRDRLLRTLLHSFDDVIDYDDDVKPWLGDHVAIAGWEHDGNPEMEIVLESTDDSSARRHLGELGNGEDTVVMHDGYAVVGSSAASATAAVAAASKSSLADTGPYDADIDALPDNEAITAWFDGPAAKDVLAGSFLGGPEQALSLSLLGGFGGSGMGELFKGRIALGVHVTDTVAQLDVRNVGGPTSQSAPATMLTSLPQGTIGAVELGDPGQVVDAVTPLVRFFGAFDEGSSYTCSEGGSVTASPGYAPYPVPDISRRELVRQLRKSIPAGPERRALIHRVLRERAHALRQLREADKNLPENSTPMPDCYSDSPPQPTDPFGAIHDLIGISFPADVKTLLGDRAVVTFGGLELGGMPDVAIRSHPADLSTAESIANTLSSHVSAQSPVNIDVSNAGDDLVLATSSSYGAEIAKTGSLGEQDEVKTALADMPDSVNVAAYVNLSRIWPLLGDDIPNGIQHLHTVGFWAATANNVQTAQLRLVTG